MPGDQTLIGALPSGFEFFGDLLFKWVPASVIAVSQSVSGSESPYSMLTDPVSAVTVPSLLAQTSAPGTYDALLGAWYTWTVLSFALSIPFLAVVIYTFIRIMQIRTAERRAVAAAQRTVAAEDVPRTQLRWNRVLDQASSSSPEGWRLAILEADIMLNELLDLQGYKGETMADKMKRVERGDFNTIDDAWEAHKVRNRVAHEGSAHELSPREVRRIINLYERVFKEFKYIE
ncbi:MAG: hypothetical protein HYS26_01605 [Candidatus Kaiserbacteria bacterium]|nr:MAG: hypothetical protein HYS26_01605 [Candidatus Kaiserbacteria bacterium]